MSIVLDMNSGIGINGLGCGKKYRHMTAGLDALETLFNVHGNDTGAKS